MQENGWNIYIRETAKNVLKQISIIHEHSIIHKLVKYNITPNLHLFSCIVLPDEKYLFSCKLPILGAKWICISGHWPIFIGILNFKIGNTDIQLSWIDNNRDQLRFLLLKTIPNFFIRAPTKRSSGKVNVTHCKFIWCLPY